MSSSRAQAVAEQLTGWASQTNFEEADEFQQLTGRVETLIKQEPDCSQAFSLALAASRDEPWHDHLKVAIAGASAMLNVHSESTGDVLITLLGLPVKIEPPCPLVQLNESQQQAITDSSYGHWLGQPDTGLLFMTDTIVPLSVLDDQPHRLLHEFLARLGAVAANDASAIGEAHRSNSELRQKTLAAADSPVSGDSWVGIYLMWELWGEGQIPPITKFQIMPQADQVKWVTAFRDTLAQSLPEGSRISMSGIFPMLDAIERARQL